MKRRKLCHCKNPCCIEARKDLKGAREWARIMAVHEAYSPHMFHAAMTNCYIIESHLKYCPYKLK